MVAAGTTHCPRPRGGGFSLGEGWDELALCHLPPSVKESAPFGMVLSVRCLRPLFPLRRPGGPTAHCCCSPRPSWLPWWGLVAFSGALLLIRLDRTAEVVRVPLLLLAAGLTALPLLLKVNTEGYPALLAYAALFLPVVLTAAVLHIGLNFLEVGRASGAAWLALLLLPGVLGLAPSPVFGLPVGLGVGFLALLLAALGSSGPEERPTRRLAGTGRAVWNVALLGSLLAGTLVLGVLALPSPSREVFSPEGGPAAEQTGEAPGSAEFPEDRAQEAGPTIPGASRFSRSAGGEQLPGADLIFLGGGLFLLAAALGLWRLRSGRAGPITARVHWWEIAAVAGMILLAVLLMVYGLSARSSGALPGAGGSDTPGSVAPGELVVTDEKPPGWLAPFAHGFNLIAFAAVLLCSIALVILAWRLRRSTDEEGGDGEEGDDGSTSAAQPEALHRVRLAYRAALASLAGAGLGRGQAETPAEHASRVTRELPTLAAPLGALVAAYAPVRYGGRVTDEDADIAEQAAREVAHLTAGRVSAPEREAP